MKNAAMRFCGYSLRHNPATLRIDCAENIRELGSPCCAPKSACLGNRLRHIVGEGELYGADCIEQFRALEKLCANGEEGLLSLPKMPSIHAYLKELRMLAEPKEDMLKYRFEFVESRRSENKTPDAAYYMTVVPNESLWDIAYRYKMPIETLVHLNPQIRYIDWLEEGERVRLC